MNARPKSLYIKIMHFKAGGGVKQTLSFQTMMITLNDTR
jgi:hypothetical protein